MCARPSTDRSTASHDTVKLRRVGADTAHAMQRLLECARVACLRDADVKALQTRVKQWRVPQPGPLAEGVPCAAAALQVARRVVQRRVDALRDTAGQHHTQIPRQTDTVADAQGVFNGRCFFSACMHQHDVRVHQNAGLHAAARVAAAAMVVRYELALLEPLLALLHATDEDTAARACQAAWAARL